LVCEKAAGLADTFFLDGLATNRNSILVILQPNYDSSRAPQIIPLRCIERNTKANVNYTMESRKLLKH
jgi:hypothetical protein